MENQETYLNTDAWSSSFVESNLRLWESILMHAIYYAFLREQRYFHREIWQNISLLCSAAESFCQFPAQLEVKRSSCTPGWDVLSENRR